MSYFYLITTVNFNGSEVLNLPTGTSVHAHKGQKHKCSLPPTPQCDVPTLLVFFPDCCQSGAKTHLQRKKNPCFYSNIEDTGWNFLEHDLKVTNKTEASGTVGESFSTMPEQTGWS